MTLFKKPASVKGTLLTLLLPAGILLMVLAWLVHGLLLDRMSRSFLESRLKDEAAFLEHQIRNANGELDAIKTGDYFQDVFHHAFAVHSPSKTLVSPKAWRPLLMPLLEAGSDGITRVQESVIPEAPSDILAYRTSFQVNQTPVVVIVSEDLGALKRSQGELHAWTAIVSLLLITLLVAVIWFGINLSMKPVTPIKAALKRLQEGEDSRIDVEAPEEFQPLVLQLNQLLDSLDQRLERSREAVANLSHSVKTPIAAVRQILEDDTRPLDSQLRHQMASRLDDINKQLESEMRRSQFAGPQVGKFAHPIDQARDLLWLMGRLYPGKSFELSSSLPEETRWPIEEHDLSEVLGNLLDNAGKWSKQCVELELKQANGTRQVIVTDDGPGVKENEITQLGQRGLRLDQQMPGHGLGLAIVEDIVSRYSGKTHFVTAANGGLRVIVEL
ncbi:ATP-binding protein [Marinobacter persicus]|jgi:signal transduction histidine kinase|uniref:histidine kinase n=1 Tax=Marinobacter persicus TaxID=930118 RepID=A0A2S6G5I9_9GAMM|nr:ATP-binding protein [Marinobacter persicus]KXS54480.1 MAG: two-component sensor [Marinobacter sp. T13-3]PPK50796.1 signal transduction histidine kinase [Marinobacter persicus]PPK54248.1 signal transduction histidine kinase [Marinobacter persicus]PPK57384.1 signal transduction histidine kinase [Marinobacter persicus]